jgi:hypothetical protein
MRLLDEQPVPVGAQVGVLEPDDDHVRLALADRPQQIGPFRDLDDDLGLGTILQKRADDVALHARQVHQQHPSGRHLVVLVMPVAKLRLERAFANSPEGSETIQSKIWIRGPELRGGI